MKQPPAKQGVAITPGGIRTPDRRIRNPLLYPSELRAQMYQKHLILQHIIDFGPSHF